MPKEEAIPVRTTDLKHLKRDIRRIPDGNGKLDNAFWCAALDRLGIEVTD